MLNSLVWHHPNGDAILIQLRIEPQMYILQFKVSASNALKAI
jgi:hypothetical protein